MVFTSLFRSRLETSFGPSSYRPWPSWLFVTGNSQHNQGVLISFPGTNSWHKLVVDDDGVAVSLCPLDNRSLPRRTRTIEEEPISVIVTCTSNKGGVYAH